jgi:drug/metabolite transporter (DMT)-like permease
MRHLGTGLIVIAAAIGVAGAVIYVTERGVANEIKGFVLLLIAAVLFVGGCLLLELRALRRSLKRDDDLQGR